MKPGHGTVTVHVDTRELDAAEARRLLDALDRLDRHALTAGSSSRSRPAPPL